MKDKAARIAALEKKIDELKQVANDDIHYSFREATQTAEMLQLYERQLHELKGESESFIKKVVIKNSHEQMTYFLVNESPNPFERRISIHSDFGEALNKCRVGDRVLLRDQYYTVESIE